MPQPGLEVAAHAGGDPVGTGVPSTYAVRHLSQPRERRVGVGAQRGDGHDAAQVQELLCRNGVREGVDIGGQDTTARRVAVEAHLEQHLDGPVRGVGALGEGGDELRPVDRLDDVGVARDVRRLVALQPADEVEGRCLGARLRERVLDLAELLGGLLVAVLAEVPDAEVVQEQDVGGREVLRDDDEGDVVGVASGLGAAALDARAHGTEVVAQLVASRLVAGRRAAGHACTGRSATMPAKRPVRPSRR